MNIVVELTLLLLLLL